MALTHGLVSIGTTATLLSALAAGRDGQTVLVQNPSGGASVYLGGSDVTTNSYGYVLVGGADLSIDLLFGESLYGVVASSTQTVRVLRQGV
jgi:hypothetical protein